MEWSERVISVSVKVMDAAFYCNTCQWLRRIFLFMRITFVAESRAELRTVCFCRDVMLFDVIAVMLSSFHLCCQTLAYV